MKMQLLVRNTLIISGVVTLVVLLSTGECSSIQTEDTCAVQGDILSCPAWFKPGEHNGSCQCGNDVLTNRIHCDSATNETKILSEYCATFNAMKGTVFGGSCPHSYLWDNSSVLYEPQVTLPHYVSQLNEAMCGPLNRTGLLCSQCQEGLGPPVLSYKTKCLECFDSRYGWLVYAIAALGPTTVFCIIIIACRIDANTPSLNLAIMICQLLVSSIKAYPISFTAQKLNTLVAALASFYGLWNLDFFRSALPPFCISSEMNTLQIVVLDYLVALYPLILTAILYYCIEFHGRGYRVFVVLWKPFHPYAVHFRRAFDLKDSVVNVFATLMLLSYCKLLYTSNGLLRPVTLHNGCGDTTVVLYNEASISFFSKSHLPYAILAIALLTVFVLLPLVFILFYQNRLFQRCLVTCRLNITLFLEVAKVSHRSFKDGINGTPDCRWYAGVYLIYRIVYVFINGPLLDLYFHQGLVLLTGVATILCALLQPYKRNIFNVMDTVFLGIFTFGIVYFRSVYPINVLNYSIIPAVIMATFPLLYFICFVTFKLLHTIKSLNCSQALIQAMKNKIRPQSDQDQHVVPYRLEHPAEYEPLLPPAGDGDSQTDTDTNGTQEICIKCVKNIA